LIENFLASPGTETEIEDELHELCGQLPSPFDNECNNIVNTYLPVLIQWIINHENPAVLCSQLALC